MVINGREIKFRRTVKANCLLAEHAPNKDIRRYPELWNTDNYADSQLAAAYWVFALNDGYENWLSFQDHDHVSNPLTVEEIMSLDEDTFAQLFMEAIEVYRADGKQTVQTQPKKSKKKEQPQPSD